MRWLMLALAVCAATVIRADDDQKMRLEQGEVELTTRLIAGDSLPEITAVGLIDSPPEHVWAIIQDCGNFQRTLAVYRVHAVPKTALPDALLQQEQRTALPDLFRHLRQITQDNKKKI